MSPRRWLYLAGVGLALLVALSAMRTDTSWDGVDVAVVGKYATDLGRAPWTPFINVQGDLQLFVFTVAGLIGGFTMGYYWRTLFANGSEPGDERASSAKDGN